MTPQRRTRARSGRAMFSRTERCMSRASEQVPWHIHEAGRDGISGVQEAHLGPIHE